MAWKNMMDLVVAHGPAPLGLVGAPMEAGSVTPGRCDLAPAMVRRALRRFSTYDVEAGQEIDLAIHDHGDINVQGIMPGDGFLPIRDAVASAVGAHALTLLIGGNNAITRPGAHGLGVPLERVGLITLDAHFDLRDTSGGLTNGNPVRALLEDGLPGRNICQLGLAPFANTSEMHRDARQAGIHVRTLAECLDQGMVPVLEAALDRLAHVDRIIVDFDIDVIDRAQCPGAPGARPGGLPVTAFFQAARFLAGQEKVRLVDLTEFDPALDVSDITALTAGRWACEIAAGFQSR